MASKRDTAERAPARRRRNATGLKGVRMRKWGRWVSEIRIPKSRSRIWLGSYDAPEKAARAYDAALYCLRGPRANFNYVADRRPEFPGGMPARLTRSEIKALAATFASFGAAAAAAALTPPHERIPHEAAPPSPTPSPKFSTITATPGVPAAGDTSAAALSDQANSFVGVEFTGQDTFLHENFLLEDQIMSGKNRLWDVL
ncbi:ethylene-responsive transcription factor ERF015-like [Aristolochia californica]|uniref:ethylene-responsive transcription factor ERF015-like n=1 Tax=Aristolochia californica TaxID=171875 RepID=UPI0035D81E8B